MNPAPVSVKLDVLRIWIGKLLVKKGMFAAEADLAALRLIESELLGRPVGGLRWLPRLLEAMDVGDIDPRARVVTLTDLPALLVIDGSTGVGQVVITKALEAAVKKAGIVGSAMVVVKNSRPLGDPLACLATATTAGCLAGIMTTCKAESEPWPIGPMTQWAWPGQDGSLVSFLQPASQFADRMADIIAIGLGGKKPSSQKKRLFADDAEHVCFLTDIAKCTPPEEFELLSIQAAGTDSFSAAAWIFDTSQWPATAPLPESTVTELRNLATIMKLPAEW